MLRQLQNDLRALVVFVLWAASLPFYYIDAALSALAWAIAPDEDES